MQSVSSNGVAHAQLGDGRHGVVYGGAGLGAATAREPLAAVLDLGRGASRFILYALVGAIALHAFAVIRAEIIPLEMMTWARVVGRDVHYRLFESYEIDLLKPAEPPPPPPLQAPEPVKEPPKEAPPPPAPVKDVAPPPAAPAAARAAAVLTAPAEPDAPANFDGIISGTGETFAGGSTAAAGTSRTAVRGRVAASGGAAGGTGTAPTGPLTGPDKSRVAGLSGSKDWGNCPFPSEADAEQIDQAFPTIQVSVRADGTPEHVAVLSDPGHGFGRAAVRCAMDHHYDAALDHDGKPIPGLTKSLRVRFER